MSYEERLFHLGLTTLKERRVQGDLIQQFKISTGIDRISFDNPQVYAPSIDKYNLRGHYLRLERQRVKNCQERFNFFTNRIVNVWNKLPLDAVKAESVNSFKVRVHILKFVIDE